MATQSGFSNLKMRGPVRHLTVSPLGSNRTGLTTSQVNLFEISAIPLAITDIQYNTKDEKYLILTLDGNHNAHSGDVVRFTSGALIFWEIEILKALSPTKLVIGNIGNQDGGDVLPVIGDELKLMRWVTAKSDSEGNLNFSPGPTTFIKDGISAVVAEDSANPANNKALPSLAMIYKNGVQVPVSDSDSDPNDVVAVPVKITDVGGAVINITAGDINVQTSDMGVNFDSQRIGDGSGVYLKIEADGSINAIVDQSVAEGKLDCIKAVLDLINGKDFATETKLEAVRLLIASLDGKDFATEATLSLVSTKLDSLATTTGQAAIVSAIQNIVFDKTGLATSAKQDSELLKLTEMDLELENQTTALGGIDTKLGTVNTKLTEMDNAVDAMSSKLPASLGAKTGANSLSIIPASDSGLATEAKQDAGIVELIAIKNSVSAATFIPKTYTEVGLTYNAAGDIGTVVYKDGVTTVATLTLGYTDGNLTSVVKS